VQRVLMKPSASDYCPPRFAGRETVADRNK
jgi:hypothetical protein